MKWLFVRAVPMTQTYWKTSLHDLERNKNDKSSMARSPLPSTGRTFPPQVSPEIIWKFAILCFYKTLNLTEFKVPKVWIHGSTAMRYRGKNVTLRRRDKDLMITETITWYGDHIMEITTWRKMPSFPHWQWRLSGINFQNLVLCRTWEYETTDRFSMTPKRAAHKIFT